MNIFSKLTLLALFLILSIVVKRDVKNTTHRSIASLEKDLNCHRALSSFLSTGREIENILEPLLTNEHNLSAKKIKRIKRIINDLNSDKKVHIYKIEKDIEEIFRKVYGRRKFQVNTNEFNTNLKREYRQEIAKIGVINHVIKNSGITQKGFSYKFHNFFNSRKGKITSTVFFNMHLFLGETIPIIPKMKEFKVNKELMRKVFEDGVQAHEDEIIRIHSKTRYNTAVIIKYYNILAESYMIAYVVYELYLMSNDDSEKQIPDLEIRSQEDEEMTIEFN